jgi:hypothetical protein
MHLSEILAIGDLGLRVIVAPPGADPEIRWAHTSDLPDPAPYLRGGELLLTNGLWLADAGDAERFVAGVRRGGAAAIGYAVYRDQSVPQPLADACAREGIPLIEVPDQPFMNITEAVLERILEERSQQLRRSVHLEHRVTAALTTSGIQGVLDILEDEHATAFAVIDGVGHVVAHTGLAPTTRELHQILTTLAGPQAPAPSLYPPDTSRAPAEPVFWSIGPHPFAAALLCRRSRDDLGAELRRDVATVLDQLRLALRHHDELQTIRDRAIAAALVHAIDRSVDPARRRDAVAAHYAGTMPASLLAVSAPATSGATLANALAALMHTRGEHAVIAARDGAATLLKPSVPGPQLDAAALGLLATMVGGDVAVGASRPTDDLGALPTALVEAEHAAAYARATQPLPAIAESATVGSHLLLLALNDDDTRLALEAAVLEPLRLYDADHATSLVETVRVFLDEVGSWQRAAARLHVHVNTLRYRLARVEQLTGRPLNVMANRVDLYLALRAADLRAARDEAAELSR